MNAYQLARAAIDKAHSADPKQSPEGLPAELVYADRMEAWLLRLLPEAPELLRLGARAQHLERWSVPRDSFPLDKVGYHAWRKSLYVKQADRAQELLLAAGVPEAEARELHTWVSKTDLRLNAGTQALEDAACLVFLESEIADFARQHADYTEEKFITILRRTWAKMSEPARGLALSIPLSDPLAALVRKAVA
jgi:tRNAThr (cytosine32-N3)-methyltransferase